MSDKILEAVLRCAHEPDENHYKRLKAFINKKYGAEAHIAWQKDMRLTDGFILKVGYDTYDWSLEGRVKNFRRDMEPFLNDRSAAISLVKEKVDSWEPSSEAVEAGRVITVGDEVARISGLKNAKYGEILLFEDGTRGMVQDLKRDSVGCVVFGSCENIFEGDEVYCTGKTAGVPVGEGLLGRVVNALGSPVDGKGNIDFKETRPVESEAPSIMERQKVNCPMETGILAVDSMFPIGRGQRELIIGDRQTGKTAIALDTILNQKDKNVICIYVAIGQKMSSVAGIVSKLEKNDAMGYTVVVNSPAGDPASLQYIAPYAGCAIGEYFMYQGKNVLVVYDDLSKHAVAYRTLSLLLGRAPGREAYPGDVFYIHSRLLERSAHLCDELGGGSMTALPIVETQAGDVSAYIPTNIISITDGQLFLESNLFFSGQRPAVNVGLSVSRVGGDAQTKAMKKASGAIRLDLAQYREMEVFTQFSGDLDEITKRQLTYGQGLMELLKQKQYSPLSTHQQVITLLSALNHVMQNIPVKKIKDFQEKLIRDIEESQSSLCRKIDETGDFEEDDRKTIIEESKKFLDSYTSSEKNGDEE